MLALTLHVRRLLVGITPWRYRITHATRARRRAARAGVRRQLQLSGVRGSAFWILDPVTAAHAQDSARCIALIKLKRVKSLKCAAARTAARGAVRPLYI